VRGGPISHTPHHDQELLIGEMDRAGLLAPAHDVGTRVMALIPRAKAVINFGLYFAKLAENTISMP
jgi:hypothetical protein